MSARLAAAADADKGDTDALVGPVNARGTGRSQRQGRGPGSRGFQEITAVDFFVLLGHQSSSGWGEGKSLLPPRWVVLVHTALHRAGDGI